MVLTTVGQYGTLQHAEIGTVRCNIKPQIKIVYHKRPKLFRQNWHDFKAILVQTILSAKWHLDSSNHLTTIPPCDKQNDRPWRFILSAMWIYAVQIKIIIIVIIINCHDHRRHHHHHRIDLKYEEVVNIVKIAIWLCRVCQYRIMNE